MLLSPSALASPVSGMTLFAFAVICSPHVQALQSSISPFIAVVAILFLPLHAFPAKHSRTMSCWDPFIYFRSRRNLPQAVGTTEISLSANVPNVGISVASNEEQSYPCISEPSVMGEIKNIWGRYKANTEAFFNEPAMYMGQECTLRSFKQSGQEAIRMQCQTLEGMDVVPECLSYSLGPHHYFIISPHVVLKDIGAPAFALKIELRQIFYYSLASTITEMHKRHVSLKNIKSIIQYDPSTYLAVITEFSQQNSFNVKQKLSDWTVFFKNLPEDIKGSLTETEYLINLKTSPVYFVHGDYKCHKKLGMGSYGIVYGCTDSKGAEFAIKTFNEDGRQPCADEIYFLDQMKGVPFVIQRKHDVTSLSGKIKNIIVLDMGKHDMFHLDLWQIGKDDDLETMKKYFAQIALAIYGIHLKGIIHEDLKPTNILVMNGGKIAVTDFGISKKGKVFNSRWNRNDGFQPYFHPTLFGISIYGSYVDWWAFGVILHQFFCHPVPQTNANYHNYGDLIVCKPMGVLPDEILDLFQLIFSRATYSSQPITGAPNPTIGEVAEAIVAIGFRIGCKIVNMEYFDLETEPTWKDWKNACVEIQRNKV